MDKALQLCTKQQVTPLQHVRVHIKSWFKDRKDIKTFGGSHQSVTEFAVVIPMDANIQQEFRDLIPQGTRGYYADIP